MEGWRQRRIGSEEDHSTTKSNYKTDLTLTGLLMEGLGGEWYPHPNGLNGDRAAVHEQLDPGNETRFF